MHCFMTLALCFSTLSAESEVPPASLPIQETPTPAFEPFTGSITGSRVRMRLQPTLDSVVLKECSPHDLLQVVGETDGFYAILPDSCYKGYIFRTYVLDGAVEGNNVNIRLKPDTASPVITQLQQGDKVSGAPCKENPKWLEMALPASVRFYVAKEFVTREGPLSLYGERIALKKELLAKIASLDVGIKAELAKPFNEIDPSRIKRELEAIVDQSKTDMPDVSKKAAWLIRKMEQDYMKLRVQQQPEQAPVAPETLPPEPKEEPAASKSMKAPMISHSLKEQEERYIQKRIDAKEIASPLELYTYEQKSPVLLRGKIIPFERALKVKPGDFILIHPITKVPVAYLYSSQVDLESLVGTMVAIEAGPRPNHDFALPAYFVYVATPIEK